MITVSVLFFAHLVDVIGSRQLNIRCASGSSVQDIVEQLTSDCPKLAESISTVRFAVNEAFCTAATLLHDGDEVAFMPPVSGGQSA